MFRSLKELLGYKLLARGGHLGKVHNFLFDDEDWKVRYLVVDTGPWILGRKVLISFESLGQPVWGGETFPIDLTREQVKNSPDVDLAKPVSRQYEEKLRQHYNWPAYWGIAAGIPGRAGYIPPQLFVDKRQSPDTVDSHLRSTNELYGYQVNAIEGEVGSLVDFIVDDEDWQFRYMIVDISNWLGSEKQVPVALEWVDDIDVARKEVLISLNQDAIKHSPPFDPTLPVNRQYEEVIYDYYGRPKYWQIVEPQDG
jgi:sporulation protein YlmC with PRC-barrel domain